MRFLLKGSSDAVYYHLNTTNGDFVNKTIPELNRKPYMVITFL